ncbi:MAG: serine protein kinase RIO [Thermoplasmata archaeon]|nr:MAG: serine protein kinase RIO [Thermoplasmata archaeon]
MVSEKVYKLLESRIDGLKKEERVERDADQRKTYDEVFDQATLMNIYKLIIDKHLDTLDFPISTGKEANVFKGTTPEGESVAVKIYRIATATYKHFKKYIEGDPRFRNVKGDHRSQVYTWAQKEFKNLKRMCAAEVRVPEPVTYIKNILVMEYIGTEEGAAPMLKDIELENPQECFDILVNAIEILYNKGRLVHGDFSEYNILVPDDDIVLIDVGQSVLLEHPMAQEMIERDIKNLVRYFEKYKLKTDIAEIRAKILKDDLQELDNDEQPSEEAADDINGAQGS